VAGSSTTSIAFLYPNIGIESDVFLPPSAMFGPFAFPIPATLPITARRIIRFAQFLDIFNQA
jgi:hypothetical protein